MKYTPDCSERIAALKRALDDADAVVIGAGAGLSAAAGFDYSGKRFADNFADFIDKYGFTDMYTGGFYPFDSLEEHWAYWSRYVYINRYTAPPKPVYDKLFTLVENKNYFVLTTNVDHCFQRSGFDKRRLFYTQGDYGLFQCSEPCHAKTYDNESAILEMTRTQRGMKIPTALVPRCPVCGKPMTMNLRSDDAFVQDDGWYAARDAYSEFLRKTDGKRILFLELGVGANTPAIIKYPFLRMTARNRNSVYACINRGEAYCPRELSSRAICINADIGTILEV